MPNAATPWETASFNGVVPRLLFGSTFEDAAIEREAFAGRSRVFCIAAAGDTARALAATGHVVTAVDINPLQVAYAQSRAAGGLLQTGVADRWMARGRGLLWSIGWSRAKLDEFLNLTDPAAQLDYWDRRLDTRRWRAAVDTLLAKPVLRLAYRGSFLDTLPCGFGERLRARLRRGWGLHPNRANPYAANLLLGTPGSEPGPPVNPIQFICADAAAYLEGAPAASFDAFSLSNIGDGAPPAYLRRLWDAVKHAAAPSAMIVARSFAEPAQSVDCNWAVRDRSLLWGVVNVIPADQGGI
jgi:S-adenosylmethionine:diacylglycerol 3-amino-3-carboxypropyl transferase